MLPYTGPDPEFWRAEAAWWEMNGWRFDPPTGTFRNDELTRLALDRIGGPPPERWPVASAPLDSHEYGRGWAAKEFSLARAVKIGSFLYWGATAPWSVPPHIRGVGKKHKGDSRHFAWYGIALSFLPDLVPLREGVRIPEEAD